MEWFHYEEESVGNTHHSGEPFRGFWRVVQPWQIERPDNADSGQLCQETVSLHERDTRYLHEEFA